MTNNLPIPNKKTYSHVFKTPIVIAIFVSLIISNPTVAKSSLTEFAPANHERVSNLQAAPMGGSPYQNLHPGPIDAEKLTMNFYESGKQRYLEARSGNRD
jgi:hypothetical protein